MTPHDDTTDYGIDNGSDLRVTDAAVEIRMMDKLQLSVNKAVNETIPVDPCCELGDSFEDLEEAQPPDPTGDVLEFEALVNDIDENWEDEMLDL